ncbi:ArdC-like ssDNA-binding domain-containing protein (plasmid) [Myxococcus stipitatus]|uniref:ArdC-like ssDNA-binding domain-containing protein n=1 Tax=Myxococcus stipitatus TaxID=83455 RepID=UPI0031451A38
MKKHSKTFDREAWAAERESKLDAARAALTEGIKALVTGEDWANLLRQLAHFGPLSISRYSFSNQVLLLRQNPGCSYAATFQGWKELGRSVKRGEKALLIRQPSFARRSSSAEEETSDDTGDAPRITGFRALAVFALSQTDGLELAIPPAPDVSGDEAFPQAVETLRSIALALPGAPVAAITIRETLPGESANGWYMPSSREIVVLTGSPSSPRARPAIFRTLVHELAHALLHGAGDHHARAECEVEAESTAFLVCHALNLDTGSYSFPYVAGWASHADDPVKAVERTGDRITKAARTILAALMPADTAEQLADLAA